MGCQDVA
ncbi:hypothetical protein E2C01_092999 [Portunus trituberculatus]|nr:hypothetical protein [Portunus trituberculatus]